MSVYVEAGARYFVAQAAHHDNFHNWNSRFHDWNAVKVGPHKDIVGLWRAAARSHGLRFGLSEHIGATFSWFVPTKWSDTTGRWAGVPYDGQDPRYDDLYLPNRGAADNKDEWYTSNPWWHHQWFAYAKDLIDAYQPDLLYSDGGVPFGRIGLNAVAHLYNTSARLHGGVNEAVYTQKDVNEDVFSVGVLDIERGQRPDIASATWQTDTCVGGWFYDYRAVYKTPKQVAEMLVDIVSKNGNMLLNIPQRPDGTVDDECLYILDCMARWITVNGEGIYATIPWTSAGEGPSRVVSGHFKEDAVDWTGEDFRFTSKDGKVYAFQMMWPDSGKTVIKSLALGSVPPVASVALLGSEGAMAFDQTAGGLAIDLPATKPCDYTQCFRIAFR